MIGLQDLTVLQVASHERPGFTLGRDLSPQQRLIVERDWESVQLDWFYRFGMRSEIKW